MKFVDDDDDDDDEKYKIQNTQLTAKKHQQ